MNKNVHFSYAISENNFRFLLLLLLQKGNKHISIQSRVKLSLTTKQFLLVEIQGKKTPQNRDE